MFKLIIAALLTFPVFGKTIVLTEHNAVAFNGAVTGEFVAKKQLEIIQKSTRLSKADPIYLVLDTPGGSVTDGLLFIDTIKALGRPVHTITIFAASMGYQIAQELGTRYILPSGTLMSHRGAVGGLSGQVPGELNARLNHIQSLLHRMNIIASRRIGMSVSQYQSAIVNELWSYGAEAVATKQADQVANVVCNDVLIRRKVKTTVITMFGQLDVVVSACPLITSPLSVGSNLSPAQQQKAVKEFEMQKRRINLTF